MPMPFLKLLQDAFAERELRPAVVYQDRTWNYSQLDARVRCVAGFLQCLGATKGDRVALCMENKEAFVFSFLAALYAGAVPLPLNPRFTREELRFFVNDSSASVAITNVESANQLESMRSELPSLRHILSHDEIFGAPPVAYRSTEINDNDPCLLMYSSGTTGWPKGVVHTHGNVASGLLALQKCWRFTPDDVVLNVLPLFHIHGLCFATLLTLLSGGCVILDDFEPLRTLARIGDCSVFMAVPTIYYRFLEQPSFRVFANAWKKPRLFTCGSAPIRAEVLPELEAIIGQPVINRYGMTEAFVITSLPIQGPWPNGSVGKPLDGIEVRVTNADGPADKNVCPTDTVGAVQIRGPNLFREYWNQPDATKASFDNGWFDTGDLGFLDPAGFLTLAGRKNDLIITSGFNVYPQVVERVINECPGVRESAVVGVPDERKGERVVAVIVRADPTLKEERLRAFCNERLVDYQRPRSVVFLDALPRNAMGKVVRRELRGLIEQEAALQK
jgi:malonyl-CoA/methylmalonyl-CoA synthetase